MLSDAAAPEMVTEEDDGMMRGDQDVAAGTGGNKGVGLGDRVVRGPVDTVVPVDIKLVTSQMHFLQRMMQIQQTDNRKLLELITNHVTICFFKNDAGSYQANYNL
jgi:hypothetical protein